MNESLANGDAPCRSIPETIYRIPIDNRTGYGYGLGMKTSTVAQVSNTGERRRFRTVERIDGVLRQVTWELVADRWGSLGERRAVEILPFVVAS